MAGVLLDPMGRAEAIDEKEHRALKAHLSILRSPDFQEHESALDAVVRDFEIVEHLKSTKQPFIRKPFLSAILFGLDADNLLAYGTVGSLVHVLGKPCEQLTEEEIQFLWNALKTYRAGGWFSEWLDLQFHFTSDATQSPDARFPSPLRIIGTLTDAVEEYEKEIEKARDMVARRPDVLIPAEAPEPVTPSTPSTRKRAATAATKRTKAPRHADAA